MVTSFLVTLWTGGKFLKKKSFSQFGAFYVQNVGHVVREYSCLLLLLRQELPFCGWWLLRRFLLAQIGNKGTTPPPVLTELYDCPHRSHRCVSQTSLSQNGIAKASNSIGFQRCHKIHSVCAYYHVDTSSVNWGVNKSLSKMGIMATNVVPISVL